MAEESSAGGNNLQNSVGIYSNGDTFDNVINFINESGRKTEELQSSLLKNRLNLEEYKKNYARVTFNEGGIDVQASTNRNAKYSDVESCYRAIESIKHELRMRGEYIESEELDREHPNKAYKRFKAMWEQETVSSESTANCYVISTIYGIKSKEVDRVQNVCKFLFALNPLVTPSWVLYFMFGKKIAKYLFLHPKHIRTADKYIAKPIIKASNLSFEWLFYLALPGWVTIASIYLIVHCFF